MGFGVITCSLEHFSDVAPAEVTFDILVLESCGYPEYWTGCTSYTNLARSRPVFSTRDIFIMPNLSDTWDNQLRYVVDGNSSIWTWLHTEVYAEKEIGWLSV